MECRIRHAKGPAHNLNLPLDKLLILSNTWLPQSQTTSLADVVLALMALLQPGEVHHLINLLYSTKLLLIKIWTQKITFVKKCKNVMQFLGSKAR